MSPLAERSERPACDVARAQTRNGIQCATTRPAVAGGPCENLMEPFEPTQSVMIATSTRRDFALV
ncbi:MAG: hypothetical protein ACO38W_10270, partial [Phycisphaerales bacterium]